MGDAPAGPASDDSAAIPNLSRFVWPLFAAIAFVMGNRRLYTAPDDESYINYFRGMTVRSASSLWFRVLDEPLWTSYAVFSGDSLGAEVAIRMTLALGVFAFLYSNASISRGVAALILVGFVLDPALGTQIYFNQIRQGFALSVFLTIAWLGRRRPRLAIWFGAGTAALVHSSFLIVLLSAVAALSIRRRAVGVVLAILASLGAMLILRETVGSVDAVDLGRRSTYAFESSVNRTFFIVAIPQYVLTMLLAQPDEDDALAKRWYDLTVALLAATFAASMLHEAGPRLFYVCDALVLIVLAQNIRRPRVQLAAAMWFGIVVIGVFIEGRKVGFNEESWLGRWITILTS